MSYFIGHLREKYLEIIRYTIIIEIGKVMNQIDGSVQDCSISIANALEILQSCTRPSRWLTFLLESPCSWHTLTVSSRRLWSRPVRANLAPHLANSIAHTFPIPLLAPDGKDKNTNLKIQYKYKFPESWNLVDQVTHNYTHAHEKNVEEYNKAYIWSITALMDCIVNSWGLGLGFTKSPSVNIE